MQNKKLAIFDLDNTLTDTLALWHHVTDVALGLLAGQFELDHNVLLSAYKASPEQYRFADFEKVVDWLDANDHLPAAVDAENQYRKDITKTYICNQMRKARAEMSVFYADGLEALRDLKASKTDVAIYTDAEAAPTIKRLWLMARGVGGDPLDTLNLVNHVYCRPSFECDSVDLRDIDPEFILSVKNRMTLWSDGVSKPAPLHTEVILQDFSVKPEEAVMIGDSYKDGGCAVPAGVDFIWYRRGAICTPEAAATVESICDPGWNYGEAYMRSRFNASSNPTASIDDMRDLKTLFAFGPGNGFKSGGDLPGVHRIEPLFHLPKRYPGIGPQTHL
jgi:phosphoglycolate phosphatase-like HAD superfamily hydrolase